jgi:hypothetical protein
VYGGVPPVTTPIVSVPLLLPQVAAVVFTTTAVGLEDVIVIALLVAVAGVAQGSLEVKITVTISLLLSVVEVNVAAV